ncbi:BglG family transcription antiterminator [Fictibacillus phosphorivorans]|uniref:BglG family transcription antiterminator n=1 Tax=Fictibacillus phosphorivorans TaxID=1221500 RepID=UPI00203A8EBD|nr:BglG family transcription antiterminator [Fictibacillus phosphorivorans]MCM3716934.1 BglG family transcription antiterminator [Fictibacillus phosphorivorans]MCM3774517.1 BglG family transcription antiterminator [Fictibacillus phosphorivorans]
MYISARERKILEFLITRDEGATVKVIAEALSVSARTIHRDLKGVEDILKEYGLQLHKKSGIGIQITGDQEAKEKLELFMFNLAHNEYTPEERQIIILSELLEATEPVKLLALANDMNVTIATISHDLDKVEERLHPFELTVLRKRGYGVEIIGSETAKRRAMSKLIYENINEFDLVSLLKETIQKKASKTVDTITERLLGLVNKKKILIIEKQVEQIKKDLPYTIADSAYIGLVIHLALAIERIEQGELIKFDDEHLKSLSESKEFKLAEKIVTGLEEVFQLEIPRGEIGYITMHLMGAKIRKSPDDLFEESALQVGMLAQKLIQFVSKEIQFDLTNDPSLFQGLVAHLRPALYRLKQKMGISNPLLSRIETDYRDLFVVLEKGVREIFPDMTVPKEEIAYLVMHFASALINKEETKELKALVVCSSGIGTSKILSTKLAREIPGLKTESASLFELDRIAKDDFDLIISTVGLNNYNHDYLLVSPLLSNHEIARVKKHLLEKKGIRKIKRDREQKVNKNISSEDFIYQIDKIQRYASAISKLLNQYNMLKITERLSVSDALEVLIKPLADKGSVSEINGVVQTLLDREKTGGLGIPGTSLALYHTKSDLINEISFTIARLSQPITVNGMDGSKVGMDTILLMLSPLDTTEESLEVLSNISSLIIRDKQSINVFQNGSENEILDLMAMECKELYKSKSEI